MNALCDTCASFDHVGVYQLTSEKSTFDISVPLQNTIIAFSLSHSSTPSSSAIHLQFAPGQSLRLDQLCDFVFTPHNPTPSHTPILPRASHRAVLPIEFLPQFCQCRYLSNSEGVHQIIFRDRSIQSPSLSLTLSLRKRTETQAFATSGSPHCSSPPKPQVWGGLILLPKRTRQEQQFGKAHLVGFHSSK